jgi:chemotaxis protein CheD
VFHHRVTQFEQEVVTIHPGEYFATREDTIISTVLGSCVAVGIFAASGGVGGLNHFMLPGALASGKAASEELARNPNAKYGMYAMELLVNDLMKLGVRREDMRAKVFGGGAVLRFADGSGTSIPTSNVEFAFEYLREERIPILASDVGGREPRKIFFYARSGKVLLKRIAGNLVDLVEKDEERYLSSISSREISGPITMFGDAEKGGG